MCPDLARSVDGRRRRAPLQAARAAPQQGQQSRIALSPESGQLHNPRHRASPPSLGSTLRSSRILRTWRRGARRAAAPPPAEELGWRRAGATPTATTMLRRQAPLVVDPSRRDPRRSAALARCRHAASIDAKFDARVDVLRSRVSPSTPASRTAAPCDPAHQVSLRQPQGRSKRKDSEGSRRGGLSGSVRSTARVRPSSVEADPDDPDGGGIVLPRISHVAEPVRDSTLDDDDDDGSFKTGDGEEGDTGTRDDRDRDSILDPGARDETRRRSVGFRVDDVDT